MSEKYYQLGTHTTEQWYEIHNELTSETDNLENIPCRCITCADEKLHSPTRGTYLLTEDEAANLKNDPRIKFINIDYSMYPEIYQPPSDELHATNAQFLNRFRTNVKIYREFETSNTLPVSPTSADYNRTGYQLLRPMQKLDPWVDGSEADNYVFESDIVQYGDGRDVDVIVGDDGTWIGHPEFQNNTVADKPTGYTGGNVLPGNGTCDLLDLVLDGPYYLDPDYFNADPNTRLTTRWDGTIVPVESFARDWWQFALNRSDRFNSLYPNAGSVIITSLYTRAFNNGSNSSQSSVGDHGTCCAALTFGRTQGWAYNANKWVYNHYGTNSAGIEQGFDIEKIFHQTKPINPKYNTKNPTISSNSWGYRAWKDPQGSTWYYNHRSSTNVSYTANAGIAWLSHMGTQGDTFILGQPRWKSEMKPNSLTTALDELVQSGVIFVVAAGNSNQKQVNDGHPDFNNYITQTNGGSLENSSFLEFGVEVTGTTNRRGFPQQAGMYTENDVRIYPSINIGALDDDYAVGNLERKVGYSDRGNGIDVYFPADGTLAANRGYTPEGRYPDTYPGFTANSGSGAGVPEDAAFGGTSAACPVAAGFIACLVGLNRDWTWQDVKNYFASLDTQDAGNFYYGVESTTPTSANWTDYPSLEGGTAKVGYQANVQQTTFPIRQGRLSSGINIKNLNVNYVQRFDRGL